jgi:5-carboxymethyl-2-hydroxymuconate isomerase
MPVTLFEYTDNLAICEKIKPFLLQSHESLVAIIKTDLATCRSTIAKHQVYVVGDGNSENAFIQLSVRILPGRSEAIKQELGNHLLKAIHEAFCGEIARLKTQVRVCLTEVDLNHYYGLDTSAT